MLKAFASKPAFLCAYLHLLQVASKPASCVPTCIFCKLFKMSVHGDSPTNELSPAETPAYDEEELQMGEHGIQFIPVTPPRDEPMADLASNMENLITWKQTFKNE